MTWADIAIYAGVYVFLAAAFLLLFKNVDN